MASDIRTDRVTLAVDDGTSMGAYVASPGVAKRAPGIILVPEALGVNAQMRGLADRWAREGFVAITPDVFHRTSPGFESEELDMNVLMPLIRSLTSEGLISDVRASFDWLRAQADVDDAKICALGFCLGGRAVFLANSELPLAAAVSYYGGSIAPGLLDRASRLHAPHLFFWGGKDKNIPPEQHRAVSDALRAAGHPFVDVEFFEANHGFFNERLPERYHPAAARQSWALVLEFVRDAMGLTS
jgi:carboxymethylenebutenolidase